MAGFRNVLVVEDDVMICDLYRTTLASSDFSVETANDSEQAFKKLERFHPDLILLDVMLPGMSGIDILKELRKNPKHGCQHTAIIILTNLAQKKLAETAFAYDASGYIVKADILPTDLPKIIRSLE